MHKLVKKQGTPTYIGRIQGAPKASPKKGAQKTPWHSTTPIHSTKSNKGIEPSLKYTLT